MYILDLFEGLPNSMSLHLGSRDVLIVDEETDTFKLQQVGDGDKASVSKTDWCQG